MVGKRYSRQREMIYRRLQATDEHPTAEMLYQWLKPANPNLSLGTVYRNLNLLADEGTIIRMPFPVERYDANVKQHPHFRCGKCGSVYDMALPYDESLDVQAAAEGHEIYGHTLLFTGTCKVCKNSQQET
ncbi:MAG: transcriptional repressor [Oscillospiraceae bacterium]